MKKIFANDDDIDIRIDCLEVKAYREFLCNEYITSNLELAKAVIYWFKLEEIELKYISSTKTYTDNSFNKKKIKNKEILFIKRMYYFKGLIYIIKHQESLDKMLQKNIREEEKKIDSEVYEYLKKIRR